MTYCQSITQILRTIWVRCIPLSLRSRTRRRATPLLPTWIYSCRSRVTVSCALPFTTNVTISTSTSQTFRSWVAIFLLRQHMVFLSHSSYGMPGLAPLMNVLFLGRHDFHLSSSDRDMSWNVWNRPSGSFVVDMGISSNIMKSPSPKCCMTFWDMTVYNDTLDWSDITPICEPITDLDFVADFDLITKFWRFPWNIATGAASQQRTLTPPDTWSCPIWDLHLF